MADLEDVHAQILSQLKRVKKSGAVYAACCPAHDGKQPSLSVGRGEDNRILIKCHRGCATEDVVRKLGVTMADLMPPRANGNGKAHVRIEREVAAYYVYSNTKGEPVSRTVRYLPKDFAQQRFENGTWVWGMGGCERVLYRLPELLANPIEEPVFLCEGEKDADNVAALGLCATTNALGAGKWRDEYNEPLRGRWVVTLPHNDDVGREHTEKAQAALWRKAAKTARLELDNLKEHGDVSDWLKGRDPAEAKRELLRLALKAPVWHPPTKMQIIDAADLLKKTFPEPRWAVPGLLSDGVTLFVAASKMGKTFFALNIAISIVCGSSALGGDRAEQGEVLYLALEGGERMIRDRIEQVHGSADLPRGLHVAFNWSRLSEGGLEALDEFIEARQPRAIFIDTFRHIRPPTSDRANLYDADVEAMRPLQAITQQRVACIVLHHTNKRLMTNDPLDMVSGSMGLTASASSTLVLRRTRGDADAKLFVTGWNIEERELACRFSNGIWTLGGSAEEQEMSDARREVLNYFRSLGPNATATPKDVASALGKSANAMGVMLFRMHHAGLLKALGQGHYKITVAGFSADE